MIQLKKKTTLKPTNILWKYLTYQVESVNNNSFFHISGENGIGKSLFLREFLSYFLKQSQKRVYIIENEGSLAPSILKKSDILVDYLSRFEFASSNDLIELFYLIKSLEKTSGEKMVVINSISNFIKSEFASITSYSEYLKSCNYLLNQIFPKIIDIAEKKRISFFFTHHSTYSFRYQETTPFFQNVMHLLKGPWILLKKPDLLKYYSLEYLTAINNVNQIIKQEHFFRFSINDNRFWVFNR